MSCQTLQHEACFRNIALVAENAEEAPGVRGRCRRVGVELAAARGANVEEEEQLRRATVFYGRDARGMAWRLCSSLGCGLSRPVAVLVDL